MLVLGKKAAVGEPAKIGSPVSPMFAEPSIIATRLQADDDGQVGVQTVRWWIPFCEPASSAWPPSAGTSSLGFVAALATKQKRGAAGGCRLRRSDSRGSGTLARGPVYRLTPVGLGRSGCAGTAIRSRPILRERGEEVSDQTQIPAELLYEYVLQTTQVVEYGSRFRH
jgi:hypothetical protein